MNQATTKLLALSAVASLAAFAAPLAADTPDQPTLLLHIEEDAAGPVELGTAAAQADWDAGTASICRRGPGLIAHPPLLFEIDHETGLPVKWHGGGCIIRQGEMEFIAAYNAHIRAQIAAHGLPANAKPELGQAAANLKALAAAATWELQSNADDVTVQTADLADIADASLRRTTRVLRGDTLAIAIHTELIDETTGHTVARFHER